jgi:hypothetical protein
VRHKVVSYLFTVTITFLACGIFLAGLGLLLDAIQRCRHSWVNDNRTDTIVHGTRESYVEHAHEWQIYALMCAHCGMRKVLSVKHHYKKQCWPW